MSLALESIDQELKEKKERYFLPFLDFIRSTPTPNFLTCILCLPSQNSRTLWNRAINYAAVGKKT
jgi:hypothetical protein